MEASILKIRTRDCLEYELILLGFLNATRYFVLRIFSFFEIE